MNRNKISVPGALGKITGALVAGVLIATAAVLPSVQKVQPRQLVLPADSLYLDRNGEVISFVTDPAGRRHLWVDGDRIPPLVKQAFLAAEDRRFWHHQGVDLLAVLRALRDDLAAARILSGASTITQQLVRMIHPRPRSFRSKAVEMVEALLLERTFSKSQILTAYLNRVPLGNNLYGIEAASRVYFGTGCDHLGLAQAALLAALPKAPGHLNPYGRHLTQLLLRRNWVLDRMAAAGFASRNQVAAAKKEPPEVVEKKPTRRAPHWIDYLESINGRPRHDRLVRTTLDLALQDRLEQVLTAHFHRLLKGGASQVAAVVVDNRRAEVLALAGSIAYGPRNLGYNNGATALRSPGSSLKPFLYAQALDAGLPTSTPLQDTERGYPFAKGVYQPLNYDRTSYGPASMRVALANSLNLSAVFLLNRIGYNNFYRVLQRLQLINFPERGPGYYGLGMVVGNPEVSLLQLAAAYRCLARGGRYRPLKFTSNQMDQRETAVFSPQAAFIVTDILADPTARLAGETAATNPFPFRLAVKTGTSTHYRDCWAMGYTHRHTIGVWVGNFSGRPTRELSGSKAAVPILVDLARQLYQVSPPPLFPVPGGVVRARVCSFSGMKPRATCPHTRSEWFLAGKEPKKLCSYHARDPFHHDLPSHYARWLYKRYRTGDQGRFRLAGFNPDLKRVFAAGNEPRVAHATASQPERTSVRIISPAADTRYLLCADPDPPTIHFEAEVDGKVPVTRWFVDGFEAAVSGPPYSFQWKAVPGRHSILVETPEHIADQIDIIIE